MSALSPADRRFIAKWREERWNPDPADLHEHVLLSRLAKAYTRRLEMAVDALLGKGALSSTDVDTYDLERVHVLGSDFAYSEINFPKETRWIRPLRQHLDAAEEFVALWVRLADPYSPIGSSHNPDPSLVAAFSRRPRLVRGLSLRQLRTLANVPRWGWRVLNMHSRKAAALADGLDAFLRLDCRDSWLPNRAGITGDLVRIGKLRTTNARIVTAFAFLNAEEGEDPWERAATYFRHPYRLARDAVNSGIAPGTVAAILWPGWENAQALLRGVYRLAHGRWGASTFLPYVSKQAFDLAMEMGEWSEDDLVYPAALAVAFNKRTLRQYARVSQRAGLTLHDAALPLVRALTEEDDNATPAQRPEAGRALGRYLSKWLQQRSQEQVQALEMVKRHWMLLGPDFPTPDVPPIEVLPRIVRLLRQRGDAEEDIPPMALPLHLHHTQVTGRRALWEGRWVKSLAVPACFPLRQRWTEGKLVGRFLPRWDPRGIDLGELTNSCQHPGGAGESSAWHGQENPLGGYFVVEDKEGKVVAMSWAWWRPGQGVCFDNIEALGLGKRQDAVAAIYNAAAQFLAASGYGAVTVGKGNSDLNGDAYWPIAGTLLPPPSGVYTDARRQWVLAEGQPTKTYNPKYRVEVVFAPLSPDLREKMEGVADVAYPEGWQFLDDEDPDLYLALVYNGSVVGYAAIEIAERYINDLVVTPEHRGTGALALTQSLMAVMRGIATAGESWSADMRESTSFALLQALERRGQVKISSVKETDDRIGEDRVFAVRFVLQ